MTTQNTIKAFTISANGKQTNFIAAIERESDKAILLDVIKSSGMTTYCKTWFPKSQIANNLSIGLFIFFISEI
jgi:hypothetical protein